MKKRSRVWLKVRCTVNYETIEMLSIITTWRDKRETPKNLTCAIRLYNSLIQHDLSLLHEYFPFAMIPSQNSFATSKPRTVSIVAETAKSVDEEQTDFSSSFGLDQLQF